MKTLNRRLVAVMNGKKLIVTVLGVTVSGFGIWKNGPPPVDFVPIQEVWHGNGAVAVWFTTLSEFQGRSEADSPAPAPPRAEADESMDIGMIDPSLDDLHLEGWALDARFDYGADSSLS